MKALLFNYINFDIHVHHIVRNNALVNCNHGPYPAGNSGDFDFWYRYSPLKDRYNPNVTKYIKRWLENESNPIIIFLFLKIPSLISKDEKENIICTIDDVRVDFLGQILKQIAIFFFFFFFFFFWGGGGEGVGG